MLFFFARLLFYWPYRILKDYWGTQKLLWRGHFPALSAAQTLICLIKHFLEHQVLQNLYFNLIS